MVDALIRFLHRNSLSVASFLFEIHSKPFIFVQQFLSAFNFIYVWMQFLRFFLLSFAYLFLWSDIIRIFGNPLSCYHFRLFICLWYTEKNRDLFMLLKPFLLLFFCMLAISIVIHTIFREFDLVYLLSIIARMFIPLAKNAIGLI